MVATAQLNQIIVPTMLHGSPSAKHQCISDKKSTPIHTDQHVLPLLISKYKIPQNFKTIEEYCCVPNFWLSHLVVVVCGWVDTNHGYFATECCNYAFYTAISLQQHLGHHVHNTSANYLSLSV